MKKYLSTIFVIGGISVLVGAATFFTRWSLSPFIFTLGAILVVIVQFADRYRGSNLVLKRLYRQQQFSGLALLLTALFMFTTTHNEWVVCFCVATFLLLYTVFRISHVEEKEKRLNK